MRNLSFTLIIAVLAFLLGCMVGCKSCSGKTESGKAVSPTVVKSDTTITPTKDSTLPHKPKQVQVTPPSMAKDHNAIEWLSPQVIRIPDSAAYYHVKIAYDELYFKYNKLYDLCAAMREYDQLYVFGRDSVRVKNAVQANEIWTQQAFLSKSETVITNTIKGKARNSVWFGVNGLYHDQVIGAGASLMFQHKRGWAVEAGAALLYNGGKQYNLEYKRSFLK